MFIINKKKLRTITTNKQKKSEEKTSKIHLMSFCTLLFCYAPILSTSDTGSIGIIYILVLLFPMACLIPYGNRYSMGNYFAIAILLWICSIVSSAFGVFEEINLNAEIKYALFVLIFILSTNFKYNSKDLNIMGYGYIIMALLLSLLIIASWKLGYSYSYSTYNLGRHSIDIIGIPKNPNYISAFINISQFMILYNVFFVKHKFRVKLLLIGIVLFNLFAIALTGTRAALMCFVIMYVGLYIVRSLHHHLMIKIAIAITIILTIWLIFNEEINTLYEFYLGRRELLSDDSRTVAWQAAIDIIKDHILFGGGLSAFKYIESLTTIDALHNLLLEVALNQGTIGLILVGVLLFYRINLIKKKDAVFILFFIFVSGFPMLFQNGFVDANFWRFLIINRILINYSINSKKGIIQTVINQN